MTMHQWDDPPACSQSTASAVAAIIEPGLVARRPNAADRRMGPLTDPVAISHSSTDLYRALYDAYRGLDGEALSAAATLFVPGDVVAGRYVINDLLGRGGMGEVYEVFDGLRSRRIALKTVRAAVSDERSVIRCLRREAQLARRISHPNVGRVYGFGVDDRRSADPIYYVTMPIIEGTTLSTRLRGGPLVPSEALRIARQVLLALRATHEAGVLHRDVKCSNIMVAGEDASTVAILTDFGLARRMDDRRKVRHAGTAGSLGYSAPEQIAGEVQDERTDLFSVGVVLYEMLTGKLPVSARLRSGLVASPASPHWPVLARPSGQTTEHLRAVANRCLATDPDDRYASAEDALRALEARADLAESS